MKADDVEKFIVDLLQSSVLDSAVKDLETKAGGLFIYARLLQAQMEEMQHKTGGRKVDFAQLRSLPAGLGQMYESGCLLFAGARGEARRQKTWRSSLWACCRAPCWTPR